MNNFPDKKWLFIFTGGLIAGVLAGSIFTASPARANLFQDLWNSFIGPFQSISLTTSSLRTAITAPSQTQVYKPVVDYEKAVVSAVKKASPAVVSITISKYAPIIQQCPYNPFSDLPPEFQQLFGSDSNLTVPCDTGKKQLQEVGGGSGFIISSDGLILTNKHVVSDTSASYSVLTNDGKSYSATVLARDPVQDLAVVKISASNLPTVTLGNSDSLQLGQTVIAIGNALGEFSNTVSVGVVSGLSRTVTASGQGFGEETIQGVIQTDAAINPGNSGGPLLNLDGDVVGINTAIASGAQNIGFAFPINRAVRDIQSVEDTGEINAPYLGVRYVMLAPDIVQKNKLSADAGAWVIKSGTASAVQPNSPASKAGIKTGDIILEVDGKKLDSAHPLSDVISQISIGKQISIKINRDGKILDLSVTLEKRPNSL